MTPEQVAHALNLIVPQSDGRYITARTPSCAYTGYVNLKEPCYGILRISSTTSAWDYFIDITHLSSIEGFVEGEGQDLDPEV